MTNKLDAADSQQTVVPNVIRSIHQGLSALLLVGLIAGPLAAASLRGRVLDAQGAVVVGVRLRLVDRAGGPLRNARSGADGSYAFLSVPADRYLLEGEASSALLAGSAEIEVEGETTADLILGVSPTSVEIVVTASSTPLARREVARAMDVLDSDSIALRNEYSVAEALRMIPGVRVQQLRGPGSLVTIQTRGLRNYDTSLLIDGLRFRDSGSPQGDATAFYQDLPLVDTDRVEFCGALGPRCTARTPSEASSASAPTRGAARPMARSGPRAAGWECCAESPGPAGAWRRTGSSTAAAFLT